MGRDKIISIVWAVLTLTMTANSVYMLVSDGTTHGWIMAISCAVFPAISWAEAAKFRARGESDAAEAISSCTVLAVSIFMFLILR